MVEVIRVIKGDCRDVLPTLPDESVHCVVTSPPYWGLRDYGTAKWEGGDPACDHTSSRAQCPDRIDMPQRKATSRDPIRGDDCHLCGARRIDSQIGLEPSFQDYIETMTGVFREVRRVLRKDGTLWLNMGDCYSNSDKGGYCKNRVNQLDSLQAGNLASDFIGAPNRQPQIGLKPKDLVGMPWRLAFALQADGWYLRSDIIWSKPNPMPESVTDRPTKAHEYLFLLTKSERYYYDAEAIAEPASEAQGAQWWRSNYDPSKNTKQNAEYAMHSGKIPSDRSHSYGSTRNRRTVWEIATSPFPEAHFATFPPALVEPCIKAGTSEKGCCAKCGAPWVREMSVSYDNPGNRTTNGPRSLVNRAMTEGFAQRLEKRSTTLGFSPSCSCNAAVVSATILDCFGGAGTTGLVADRLGRNAILIELNSQYAEMAEQRLRDDAGMFAMVAAE